MKFFKKFEISNSNIKYNIKYCYKHVVLLINHYHFYIYNPDYKIILRSNFYSLERNIIPTFSSLRSSANTNRLIRHDGGSKAS